MRRLLFFAVCVMFMASCGGGKDSNIFDAPVRHAKAGYSCSISGTRVNLGGDTLGGIFDMFVHDTTLFLRGEMKDSPYMVHAYSLKDYSEKGHYVAKGRGENELLSPHFEGHVQGAENSLYLFDLNLHSSYAFDYASSSKMHCTQLSKLVKLPKMVMYAFPFGRQHFAVVPEDDALTGYVLDEKGKKVKSESLYPQVSGTEYSYLLSAASGLNSERKTLAMAMSMFPQVNFLNLETGERHTAVLSDGYKGWRNMLNGEDEDMRMYYTSGVQSSNFFMAIYSGGVPVQEWAEGGSEPHVHIFDWDGNLLYDLIPDEKLSCITFDEVSSVLYGVDSSDVIYKYDLSELMKTK